MSTQPVTNPSQLTPSQSAFEMWQSLTNGWGPQNAAAQAITPTSKTVTITVPNLAAMELVYALLAAGITPTPAQLAAQMQQETVPGTLSTPAPLPNYIFGNQIGTNPTEYILDDTEGVPDVDGPPITVNGEQWEVGALSPFTFTATLIAPAQPPPSSAPASAQS
jgi:hypothetical protein